MSCRKTLILTVLSLLMVSTLTATTIPISTSANQKLNQMPLAFTKNMGQWEDRVLFRASADGATMWFSKEGVTYQFTRHIPSPPSPLPVGEGWSKTGVRAFPFDRPDHARDSIDQLVLTTKFFGANPNPEIVAEGQMEYKCNYFLGNDPAMWRTDVPNYKAITLKDIYPGIDVKYTGDGNGRATYEYIVAPGADIAQIKVEYQGAEETSIDSDGRMVLKTKWGDMIAAIKSPSDDVLSGSTYCAWLASSSTTSSDSARGDVGQALADKSGTLTLSYSTYLGGGGDDMGQDIAVDGSGNAYVTGFTFSDFPILNPYQTFQGGTYDAFVTKLSASGTLIYSTYLGGTRDEHGYGIVVDGSENAYVTGWTTSSDFPALNPYQIYVGGGVYGYDVFVTKLSSSGASLIYSTYLGGEDDEQGYDIAVDVGGCAYVTGYTESSNFPTLNPYQMGQPYTDAFITKLSSTGNSLIYSTYLGGGYEDWGNGIAIDDSGYAYVTGSTNSLNFPTQNAYDGSLNGGFFDGDAFVTKLSRSGESLIYSTYLGGSGRETVWGGKCIAVDGSGNAYVTGWTESTDFPTLNPYQGTFQGGDGDAFVTKLSGSGNSLIYSTYLGGGGIDYGYGIAIDGNGNVYVTGSTGSSDFPTLNPFQTDQISTDAFVTKLSSSGNILIYSTHLGGGGSELGYSIAVDGSGNAYLTGETNSTNFPTRNPYQATFHGTSWYDAFVTKLNWISDYYCGDVNADKQVNLLDLVFLRKYILFEGPAPQFLALADVNCSGGIDISDVVFLMNYFFTSGSAPCAGCK
jgi:hypothetical protein